MTDDAQTQLLKRGYAEIKECLFDDAFAVFEDLSEMRNDSESYFAMALASCKVRCYKEIGQSELPTAVGGGLK